VQTPRFLVMGASGGIGQVLCERLAKQGASLLLAGRNPERLAALAERTGGEICAVDARAADEVQRAVEQAVQSFGGLEGAVNLVGSLLLKPAHLTRPEDWDDVLATNLGSAFHLVRSASRVLRGQGGSIVLVSSAAAQTGLVNHDAIAAAKAGVEGLARSAAATYAAQGIRVNCVAPGMLRTPLTERLLATSNGLAASQAMHPLGRIGEPDDVASAIAWLLDPGQGWVTGQVIGVDGGLAHLRGRPRA
jgi:NAD(P)-dependent dehydrogenase (short-subunit alcohol dehydrogenase family)